MEKLKVLDGLIEKAVEAPINEEQKGIEAGCLAGLVQALGSENGVLAMELLNLDESDFHFKDHREVFAAIKKLNKTGAAVDALILSREVGEAYKGIVNEIFKAPPVAAAAAQSYKTLIQDQATKIQALKVINEALAVVKDGSAKDISSCFGKLRALVFDEQKTKRLTPNIRSEAEEYPGFLARLNDSKPGYQTGFPDTDKLFNGLKPGLYILGAPPSAGKTTFLKQLADQVAELNQIPVLFFTYEQSGDELRLKTLARLSQVSNEELRNFPEAVKTDKTLAERVGDAQSKFAAYADCITIVEADRYHTIDAIRLIAQQQKFKTGKAPLIVIDYLQIIPSPTPASDKRLEIDYLISDLRRLARELNSPILTASAVGRAKYDQEKDPKIDAFKESGGIEFGADIGMVFKVLSEQDGGREMELHVLKHRNGRRGILTFRYDMTTDTFRETGLRGLNYMEVLERGKDLGF